MDDSAQEAARCQICHDPLLSQACCALKCGHVYHSSCFQQWLLRGKGECPNCRAITQSHELRILSFDVVEVQHHSQQEVRLLREASDEHRAALVADLAERERELNEGAAQADEDLAREKQAASSTKKVRKGIAEKCDAFESLLRAELPALQQVLHQCQQLQQEIDSQEAQQHKKLPVSQSKADDDDVKLECKILRSTHPIDRAKQLHQSLLSTRKTEAEAQREFQRLQKELKELDGETAEKRERLAEHQRRDMRRREADLRRPSSQELSSSQQPAENPAAAQASASPSGSQPASEPSQASTRAPSRTTPATSGTSTLEPTRPSKKLKRADSRPQADGGADATDNMDGLLYGVPRSRTAGAGKTGFLSKKMPASAAAAAPASPKKAVMGLRPQPKQPSRVRALFGAR